MSLTWVSSGCSLSTSWPSSASSNSRCRTSTNEIKECPPMCLNSCLVWGLSRIAENQRESRFQAPSSNPVWLCLVWYVSKGPQKCQDRCWVINTQTVQGSVAPGDSAHSRYRTPKQVSISPFILNSLKLLLKNNWEFKGLFLLLLENLHYSSFLWGALIYIYIFWKLLKMEINT